MSFKNRRIYLIVFASVFLRREEASLPYPARDRFCWPALPWDHLTRLEKLPPTGLYLRSLGRIIIA